MTTDAMKEMWTGRKAGEERKKEEGKQTYSWIDILHERVSSRFSFEWSGLVEEIIEVGKFSEFGEDLDEGVSVTYFCQHILCVRFGEEDKEGGGKGVSRVEGKDGLKGRKETDSSTVCGKFPTYSLSLRSVRDRGCCPEAGKEDKPEGPATEGACWDG